ncbi:hypothetical protein BOTBODRAFT_49611 [Botryobasidium botryosum FD-172 SS1]|uniref:Uncharacterized protein n=1 Tax=Botryobasidium botryosum (strain FD-172 SS1) TaxID=930990 RepID=A0A067LSH0_BOTB1|nr:hypothetical protein BOTBODRAFT_49611 [Botryobasidium botryosum FD-172 SS1]
MDPPCKPPPWLEKGSFIPSPTQDALAKCNHSTITAVAFHSNGHLITGDTDGRLCLWDLSSGMPISSLPLKKAAVTVLHTVNDIFLLAALNTGDICFIRLQDQTAQMKVMVSVKDHAGKDILFLDHCRVGAEFKVLAFTKNSGAIISWSHDTRAWHRSSVLTCYGCPYTSAQFVQIQGEPAILIGTGGGGQIEDVTLVPNNQWVLTMGDGSLASYKVGSALPEREHEASQALGPYRSALLSHCHRMQITYAKVALCWDALFVTLVAKEGRSEAQVWMCQGPMLRQRKALLRKGAHESANKLEAALQQGAPEDQAPYELWAAEVFHDKASLLSKANHLGIVVAIREGLLREASAAVQRLMDLREIAEACADMIMEAEEQMEQDIAAHEREVARERHGGWDVDMANAELDAWVAENIQRELEEAERAWEQPSIGWFADYYSSHYYDSD